MSAEDESAAYDRQGGVDYHIQDPFKVMAQQSAAETGHFLEQFGYAEVPASRGASAYVWEEPDRYTALTIEGLGTKNLLADIMAEFTGRSHYDEIARDTVATIINDLVTVGARPVAIATHINADSSKWLANKSKTTDFLLGWQAACEAAQVTWGPGETAVLSPIVARDSVQPSGAAIGIVKPKELLVTGEKLQAGDAVVLVESSGIHTNGLSVARRLTPWPARMSDGRMYGEALLTPSHIYAGLVRDLQDKGVDIHYLVNISGHGWRKLMRYPAELNYTIDLPFAGAAVPPPLFQYIQKRGDLDDETMFGTFNMGAGFAIMVPEAEVSHVQHAASRQGLKAWYAGFVGSGRPYVFIRPQSIMFKSESLAIR